MSDEKTENKNEDIPQNAKSYIIKCKNLERTIKELEEVIKHLSKRILDINSEKEDLKTIIRNNSNLSEELNNLKEEIKKVRAEREEMILKKDKEISNLTFKILFIQIYTLSSFNILSSKYFIKISLYVFDKSFVICL